MKKPTLKKDNKVAVIYAFLFIAFVSISAFALTQNEVFQNTPAYHLFKEIYVKIADEFYPLSNWINFTSLNEISVQGKRITNVAPPAGKNDVATKGYVDAAMGLAAGGMGLQGVLVLRDNANNYGISSVPLSLPKANCNVKITVCDYGNNPPTKLIIGADPVPRITKSRINEVDWRSVAIEDDVDSSASCADPGCGCCCSCTCPSDSSIFSYSYYCNCECPYKGCCSHHTCVVCCPNINPNTGSDLITYNSTSHDCVYCPSSYPHYDSEDQVCYATPRCPDPEPDEVFIQEDDVDNVCVYCPKDHPIYDATTKHCIREASVETIKVGNCATLSTTLESAFTDVTFADSSNNPLSTADYVAIAYSCPVE